MSGALPSVTLIARAIGQSASTLIDRARSLGIVSLAPTDPCPATLLEILILEEEQAAANDATPPHSGLCELERELVGCSWESAQRRWRTDAGLGLGLLEFSGRTILIADDDHARVIAGALRAARFSSRLFIGGPPGSGKEALARACHEASGRRGQYVADNCATIPPTSAESHLFGVADKAFTGVERRTGLFREANGGTVFLDEVGALSPDVQPKLLRVLQERVVKPSGGDRVESVDVLVIAATNEDLLQAVANGRFRMDLLDRIRRPHVMLPPLRGRDQAILALAAFTLEREARRLDRRLAFTPGAVHALIMHEWPGNVRELEHSIAAAALAAHASAICADGLGLSKPTAQRANPKPQGVHAAVYPEAKRLQDEGVSLRKIGASLGLTPRQVDRLLNRR